jgi:hypothetical protein
LRLDELYLDGWKLSHNILGTLVSIVVCKPGEIASIGYLEELLTFL